MASEEWKRCIRRTMSNAEVGPTELARRLDKLGWKVSVRQIKRWRGDGQIPEDYRHIPLLARALRCGVREFWDEG